MPGLKRTLQQASVQAASDRSTPHILLSVNEEGKVVASGTGRLVTGLVEDKELFDKNKVCIQTNMAGEGDAGGYVTTQAIAYSPLPCSPFSPKWKDT